MFFLHKVENQNITHITKPNQTNSCSLWYIDLYQDINVPACVFHRYHYIGKPSCFVLYGVTYRTTVQKWTFWFEQNCRLHQQPSFSISKPATKYYSVYMPNYDEDMASLFSKNIKSYKNCIAFNQKNVDVLCSQTIADADKSVVLGFSFNDYHFTRVSCTGQD